MLPGGLVCSWRPCCWIPATRDDATIGTAFGLALCFDLQLRRVKCMNKPQEPVQQDADERSGAVETTMMVNREHGHMKEQRIDTPSRLFLRSLLRACASISVPRRQVRGQTRSAIPRLGSAVLGTSVATDAITIVTPAAGSLALRNLALDRLVTSEYPRRPPEESSSAVHFFSV